MVVRRLIYVAILRPLIQRDYRLRFRGKRPDRMYWADRLTLAWGYGLDALPERHRKRGVFPARKIVK